MKKSRNFILFIVLIIILSALAIYDLTTGFIKIPFSEILKFFYNPSNVSDEYILLIKEFRIPRVMIAILAGAALSVSGLIMQTVFRNPLAGPDVLGVSSGASLGVAIVVLGGNQFLGGLSAQASNIISMIAAGIGAAAVLAIILAVSFRVRDILSILIIGILTAGVVNSMVSVLQYFASDINVKSFVVWTMGSLTATSFSDIQILSPMVMLFTFIGFMLSKQLNLMLPGENFANSMGVNVKHLRIFSFIIVSVLTGIVTAYCGPLGFIGIAAPHISRWIFNTSNHFILIPASILCGAIFMLCGDILTHAFTENGILPINAITAILGAPFIIWVVIRNKRTMV
jgi:iron complex transport system permease protein